MSLAYGNFCNPMASNKEGINSVTSPSTHAHLFSVGFIENDIGSFLFVLLTLSAPGRGTFAAFVNVLECYR